MNQKKIAKRDLKRHFKRINNKKAKINKNLLRDKVCKNCYYFGDSYRKDSRGVCSNPKVKNHNIPEKNTCLFFITKEEYFNKQRNKRMFDWWL